MGAWFYETTETEGFSFRLAPEVKVGAGNYVTKWDRIKPEEYYVIVPFNYTEEITDFRDYTQVMDWADTQQPSTEEELEVAIVKDSEYKALKKQEYDDIFDDDIPF